MTNFERWHIYTKHLFTPTMWKEAGWLYVIGAALQRRVWYGNLRHWPLFPNLYIVLVGGPASGKTLITSASKSMLGYHKYEPPANTSPAMKELLRQANDGEEPLLFPLGPNDITYEALTQTMSRATRTSTIMNDGQEEPYAHASMAFVLSELGSLFTRNNEKLPKFTLQTYDCEDYTYKTKHQSTDIIKNSCLSILAGCVPEFFIEAAHFKIFNDGFVSRCIFLFQERVQDAPFHLKEPDQEQIDCRNHLLSWIEALSKVAGKLTYGKEIEDYLENWYKTVHLPKEVKATKRMATYYGRKRVHIQKLAAAFHFSESLDTQLQLGDFTRAIEFLERAEVYMRSGFAVGGRNELTPIAKEILRNLRRNGGEWVSKTSLFADYCDDISLQELEEILIQLQVLGDVQGKDDHYAAYRK